MGGSCHLPGTVLIPAAALTGLGAAVTRHFGKQAWILSALEERLGSVHVPHPTKQ